MHPPPGEMREAPWPMTFINEMSKPNTNNWITMPMNNLMMKMSMLEKPMLSWKVGGYADDDDEEDLDDNNLDSEKLTGVHH